MHIFLKLFLILLIFTTSFFIFSASSDAQVCNPECATGINCVFDPSDPTRGICQNLIPTPAGEDNLNVNFSAPTSVTGFSDVMCNISDFLSKNIVPPVAVLMILVVGFLYLVSAGNPEKLKLANKIFLFTAIGVVVVLLSPALVALFADLIGRSVSTTACSGVGVTTNTIIDSIINLVDWMAWFVAVIAVLMGLYSGFLFMTAQGSSEKVEKAYKIFIFAVVGVAISMFSFGIVSIVEMFI